MEIPENPLPKTDLLLRKANSIPIVSAHFEKAEEDKYILTLTSTSGNEFHYRGSWVVFQRLLAQIQEESHLR